MKQNKMVLNKIELRNCSTLIDRSRLKREYLRFLLTTDGPTSEFY